LLERGRKCRRDARVSSVGALMSGFFELAAPGAVSAPYSHDQALVGLSMLVSVAGAFTFLELAGRAKVRMRRGGVWRAASGAMLGFSVWATHIIGLFAFQTPLMRGLDFWLTGGSAALAMASGVSAMLISAPRAKWRSVVVAGAFAALGAIVMHYLGLGGMRIEAALSYRLEFAALTGLGAFGAALIALWLANALNESWMRIVAALPVGAGMAGLHYLDMAATVITPRPVFEPPADLAPWAGALAMTAATAAVIASALLATAIDRRALALRRARGGDDDAATVVYVPEVATGRNATRR
jgi:NO-binding membrane sensor protein with MHYT domain